MNLPGVGTLEKLPAFPGIVLAVLAISVIAVSTRGREDVVREDARASLLLAQARQAIGAGTSLAGVRAITAAGRFRRLLGDLETEGAFDLALQPPDKLRRTETVRLQRGVMTRTMGVNGTRLLRSRGHPAGGSLAAPFPLPRGASRVASEEDLEQGLIRVQRAELDRLLFLWLATPPSDGPLELAYGGQAESPDGAAEVVEIRGSGEVWARLFLDARTHLPLLLAHPGVRAIGGKPFPVSASLPPLDGIKVFVEDHRAAGPLVLPHQVRVSAGATTIEEWQIETFRINPPLDPGTFEPEP